MEWFDEAWRVVNFALSIPLLAALVYVSRLEWRDSSIDTRLLFLGLQILILAGCLGSLTAIVSEIKFNLLGTPLFSIAGCWVTVATYLRVKRLRKDQGR